LLERTVLLGYGGRIASLLSRREAPNMSSHTDEHAAEVFPWMEHAIVVGALLGAVVAIGLGRASHLEPSGAVLGGLFGAAAGAAVGTCLALLWAHEAPARAARPSELWDPWLDSQSPPRDDNAALAFQIEDAAGENAGEIDDWRASVRPRVLSPETGESLPLTDVIGPILAGTNVGLIRLVGRSGSGKTTALNHLAGLLPPHLDVSFLDEPGPSAIVAAPRGWVISTSERARDTDCQTHQLVLAPWGEDEWIEYLLATDRRLCASVMARLAPAKAEATRLQGIPELWRLALDRMMADPSLPGPRRALKSELASLMPEDESRDEIESFCFAAIAKNDRSGIVRAEQIRAQGPEAALSRLVRHRPIQLLLAADFIVYALKSRAESEVLAVKLPRDLVLETVTQIAGDTDLVDRLWSLITNGRSRLQPMVASLLHALRIGWKPDRSTLRLVGAYLDEAEWEGIDLAGGDLHHADLAGAILRRSRLDSADFHGANLRDAKLSASSAESAKFDNADLSQASLPHVRAERTSFRSARLVAASMIRGNFTRANFEGADLTLARLVDAILVGVDLRLAKIEDADFSGADLSEANMQGLTFVGAKFAGARFKGAHLSRCNLEGMLLPGAFFEGADLRHALLTSSQMPGANLRGANLRAAGLAEIDWEEADLRGADLREAAFHLGSSRSGLVGSPIASEGSRTGFYTDDWSEQDFKSPEEIRKANLSGADLRGARIENVDFYLVDLRGALLDPEQILHIRRCGAILEARA
jgi:uncharacterized protein YjbI with pentapeptide repeats/energy-coupling factor transporter ATP-binding protein EcfA2